MIKNYFNLERNIAFTSKQPKLIGLFLLFFLLMPLVSFGQTTQTFNTSGTFMVPAGVTSITVEAWDAGGGSTTNKWGGSGGSGGYTKGTISVTAGQLFNYTVGIGSTGNGTGGGASTLTANGGFGFITVKLALNESECPFTEI